MPPTAAAYRWWDNRAAVLAIAIVLAVAGAMAYAGPGRELFVVTLVLEGMRLIAWLAAGTGIGALVIVLGTRRVSAPSVERTTMALPSRPSALLVFITATALGLGIMSLLLLGLGLAGWLNRPVVIALLAVGVVAGIASLMLRRRSASRIANSEFREAVRPAASAKSGQVDLRAWWRASPGWGWASLLAAPFFSVALIGTMVPAGLLWSPNEPHGYDVVEYHLQVPREWYEAGRIEPLRHNVYSFFPMGVEVHYLLAMHLDGGPWEGMHLAQLMHLSLVILALLAACGFARELAPCRSAAALACVSIATVPWLAQLGAIAYNEGGFLLFGTLAIGWALRATLDPVHRMRRFILAGAMAGFASGTKLTAVPEVLLGVPAVSLFVLLLMKWRAKATVRAKDLLGPVVFGIVGLLAFSPWLVRNLVWAGNPVFPEAMPMLGHGYFSAVQVERWERAHHAPPELASIGARLLAGWRQILSSWQFGYVLLPMALVALAARMRQPSAWFLGGMLLVLSGFWLGPTHLQGRFYLLALPLAAMAVAQVPWRWWAPVGMALVFLSAAVNFTTQLHRQLIEKLYAGADPQSWVAAQALANPDVSWINFETLQGVPRDANVELIGDAKAFWYVMPMTRLRYRTVFDVDTSREGDVLKAWEGPAPLAGAWKVIDPRELERFERTYQPLPSLPDWIGRMNGPEARPPK
jgi:hypothetical protein